MVGSSHGTTDGAGPTEHAEGMRPTEHADGGDRRKTPTEVYRRREAVGACHGTAQSDACMCVLCASKAESDRRSPTGPPDGGPRRGARAHRARGRGVESASFRGSPPQGQIPKNSDAPNRTFSLQIYFILKNVRKENTILFMEAVGGRAELPKIEQYKG